MKFINFIFSAAVLALSLSACKKDHSVLGADVQPEDDVLQTSFSDTTRMFLHTIDHKPTFCFPSETKFLGSNQDPHFGRTDVGLYTNFIIPNSITNVSFGNDANLVSAEIILAVPSIDFVGDLSVMDYSVFPIVTALSTSSVYFTSNDSLHDKNLVLGTYTGTYSVINGKLALRIPVDFNYAKAILNNPQYLSDNATLLSTYKGFYISAKGTSLNPLTKQGTISRFNLNDALSGFYLYYQNGTPSAVKENKTFRLAFSGSGSVKFNSVKYSPTSGGNSLLLSQFNNTDSTAGNDNLFLKGLGGTKLKLYMPSLKSYADSFKIAVNRAEVVLNIDPAFTSPNGQYFAPASLALLAIDSLNRENFVLDQLSSIDAARYNGLYDEEGKRYVFNIARHVQAIMNGKKKNYGFYVVVADPSLLSTVKRDNFSERVILAGINNSTLKPRFNLSYIKFKND